MVRRNVGGLLVGIEEGGHNSSEGKLESGGLRNRHIHFSFPVHSKSVVLTVIAAVVYVEIRRLVWKAILSSRAMACIYYLAFSSQFKEENCDQVRVARFSPEHSSNFYLLTKKIVKLHFMQKLAL